MKKIILILLLTVSLLLISCNTQPNDNGDDDATSIDTKALAKCLTNNEAIMYGTEWCGYCNKQKALFGEDFNEINFVDCDLNKEECVAAGVQGYPTWVIKGQNYPGMKDLATLAELSGC